MTTADAGDPALRLLALRVTLQPSPAQESALLETMVRCNRAANHVAAVAAEMNHPSNAQLSSAMYGELRERYALPSNIALHTISKVTRAMRSDASVIPHFDDFSGLFYHEGKSLSWKGPDRVSILTVCERQVIPARFERYELLRDLQLKRGNAVLGYARSVFYLVQMVEAPSMPVIMFDPAQELVAGLNG